MGEGVRRTDEGSFHTPHFAFRIQTVRQFHHVIEIAFGVIPSDVEQRQLTWMLAGDSLEPLNALELAFDWTFVLERVTPDNLRRAQRSGGFATSQPDVAIGAVTDAPQQFIIGNAWLRCQARVEPRRRPSMHWCRPVSIIVAWNLALPIHARTRKVWHL